MSFDLVLKGGTVVDGTGAPRRHADVAVKDGRIVELGKISGAAQRTIDATDLVVAPGVIDVHTHYDAQLCWDPVLGCSAEHGTTTVIQGNCGIGIAPCRPEHRDLVLQDLVVLEGMSYEVMSTGIDWPFETFPEYLQMMRRRGLGINVAPFVPLSTLRRFTLGEAAIERAATPAEREAIAHDLHAAVEAGALGFSSTMVMRQVGYQGKPLACQLADREELASYARTLRDLKRGAMQANVVDSLAKPKDEELAILDLLLTESGGRTVTYSGAYYRNDEPDAIEKMLQKVEPLRQRHAIPQTTIMPVTIEVDLRTPMVFSDVAAFKQVLNRPHDEQIRIYRDPQWRAQARAELSAGRKLFGAAWADSTVLRVKNEKMRPLLLKSVSEIAAHTGADPFEVMIDLALEDDLELKFLGDLVNTNPQHLRTHIKDPRVLIGLHDGGAHVDMLFQAGYPTYMLGHWVRREQAIELEHAIQRMTSEPADYFGLKDRGRIALGNKADFMVFDPLRVDSPQRPDRVLKDLPGGGVRLYCTPQGVSHVIVNGEVLFENGQHTGALPGQIAETC